MKKRTAVATGVGAALVAAGAIGGVAVATGGNDGEEHVSGPQADAARDAALTATHGGTANTVERGDENGATWEVEVTKTNGSTVDVLLDEKYKIIAIERS